jgi:hypothetical protein
LSINTTATLSAFIAWTALQDSILTRVTDIGSVTSELSLIYGTGLSQCDAIFHDVIELPANSSISLDFTDLTRVLFDQEGTLNFNKVRGICVKNQSEDSIGIVNVLATGSNAFTDPFNGGSGNIPVYPTTSFLLSNTILGWDSGPGHRHISVANPSATGVTIEIAVVGVTGA